jgi:membrane protein
MASIRPNRLTGNLLRLSDMVIVGSVALLSYQLGRMDARDGPNKPASLGHAQNNSGSGTSDVDLSVVLDRGRAANSPSQFGWKAWKDILVRVFHEASDDDIATVAGGITFYGLLAFFPAISALVSLYALIADPATIRDHLVQLSFLLPPNAFSIVEDQITRVVSQGGGELGFKFALSLVFSLWSANAGMKATIGGLNVAYEEQEKRSFIWTNLTSLALTVAVLAAVLILTGVTAVLPAIFDAQSTPDAAKTGLEIIRWPIMLALLTLALSALYRFAPSRAEPQWRWVTWGSVLASILVVAISLILSWYLTNLADYTKTYGSLGAVIGLMTWIWLTSSAVLLGAELNAEMEHQTARDTTSGTPLPLGVRGAKMADTVAAEPE